MDSNKLSDLKAHNQFLLGRIDAVNWLENQATELQFTDAQKEAIRAYGKRNRDSSAEQERLIAKKNAEAEEKREATKAAKRGGKRPGEYA
ncbi:MAG: hypothetical protein WC426_13490 [Sulfuriferula sp.]